MRARIADLAPVDDRSARRRLVNFGARVREANARGLDVTVIDLSPGGCKVTPPHHLEVGRVFWLKLSDLEARHCEVIWIDGKNAGCEFSQPLSVREMESVCAPSRQVVRSDRRGSFGRCG
ncbi:MAG: PilZ domain-containing protein [Allosphingosinicella sp.]